MPYNNGREETAVLIALLAILGVNLIVIVVVAALVFGRKRWLKDQPGYFAGAIRVSDGHVHGLSSKWKRGSARWTRDILVWSKAPLLFRDELVPVYRVSSEHPAGAGEVKRLGDNPIVVEFEADNAKIEVAAKEEQRVLVKGPFGNAHHPGASTTTPPL